MMEMMHNIIKGEIPPTSDAVGSRYIQLIENTLNGKYHDNPAQIIRSVTDIISDLKCDWGIGSFGWVKNKLLVLTLETENPDYYIDLVRRTYGL